ncbi:MAG: dienelactone hydrolase family protein [Chloroflexota bacterium]
MCHPEVPAGTVPPDVRTEELAIPVDGGAMPTLVAFPARTPAPAVLVVNDVFGRGPFYEHLARRLAQAGFVAATPEFFFREGALPEPTRDAAMARAKRLDFARTVDDMTAAASWLKGRADTSGAVGTIGFCMGGTIVLLLAARRQDLAASVCYYGFPADARTPARPLDLAPKMKGPILGLWGDQDAGVGMDNVKALDTSLAAAGVEHEFHIYPGLGHGFLKASLEDESTPGYREACASWTRTIAFFRESFATAG